ncbi:hypothetical protein DFH08DRAFT_985518 [Mycena albidolilacea]|uniref:Uncharacterized protein n=1 Tax=Mycena albidolilacea TaxID=1033008 RepID=A0AAD7EWF3_9AGAR|nr:hypothetical protein DFH08DRAFT_985518 [Mycena albidolilacea]
MAPEWSQDIAQLYYNMGCHPKHCPKKRHPNAWEAFARARSWGGEEWEKCTEGLITLEEEWNFPAKGLLAAPNSAEERPREPAGWKQGEGGWLDPTAVAVAEWEDLGKMVGRNGVLLYMGALLWWGEAANADRNRDVTLSAWKLAVDDVAHVLERAKEAVGSGSQKSTASNGKGASSAKRKTRTATPKSTPGKENTTAATNGRILGSDAKYAPRLRDVKSGCEAVGRGGETQREFKSQKKCDVPLEDEEDLEAKFAKMFAVVKARGYSLFVAVDNYDAPTRTLTRVARDAASIYQDVPTPREIEQLLDSCFWGPLMAATDVVHKMCVMGTLLINYPTLENLDPDAALNLQSACGFTEEEALHLVRSLLEEAPGTTDLRHLCGQYVFPSAMSEVDINLWSAPDLRPLITIIPMLVHCHMVQL